MKKLVLLLAVIFISAYSYNAVAQFVPCIDAVTITATPPPSPTGTYAPGTVVTFCITVSGYGQASSDWLCAIVPTFGTGWDSTTLLAVSLPPSIVSGQGDWGYYPTCTSTNSGLTFGPGFYFDSGQGNPSGIQDGIPGNNYGDFCPTSPSCTWEFCFSVQVSPDCPTPATTSLELSVNFYSDQVAGSWNPFGGGCVDAPIVFNANVALPANSLTVPILNTTGVICFGDTTGSASVVPSGGFTPYSYLWSNGATTSGITNLTGGVYSVIVSDSINCQKIVYLQIQSPPEIILNPLVTDIGCTGNPGSITTNVTGGTGTTYSYLWSNAETTSSITGLAAGSYTLTVTDSLGCMKTDSFTVSATAPLSLLPATSTDETCGSANGTATVHINTGTAPFTFTWTPNVSTDSTASGLTAGTYYIHITSAGGCAADDSVVVNAVATYTVTTLIASANCAGTGGSVQVSPSGSSGYTYIWTPNVSTDSTASNLNAGTYTVSVTDINGCTQTVNITVPQMSSTVVISNPVITQSIPCDASSLATVTVSASSGLDPYSYLWSSGSTDSSAAGLTAGTYTVTVTDANQCTASATATIDPIVPVVVTASPTIASCNANDGTATVTSTSGGTGPYTYMWDGGSTANSISGLGAGTYTVTATDIFGCTSSATATVTQHPQIILSVSTDTTICAGQTVTISVTPSGGTPVFSYSWDNGPTSASQQVTPTDTTKYIVTVTDITGCTAVSSVTVNVNQIPTITSLTPNTTICNGSSVTLNVSGATTYSWSPTTGLDNPNSSSPVASPTGNTTYTVTASNGNCSTTGTVDITVAASPVAAYSADTTSGIAPLTVNFTDNSSGGSSSLWNFGDGTNGTGTPVSHTYANAGTYDGYLLVTNSNGCTDTVSFRILVENTSSLTVYNIFTPDNGDSKNDVFEFTEVGISSIDVQIFNRWGNKVYEWDIPHGSWNGKTSSGDVAPDGTYFYIIKARGIDDKAYDMKGTVTLIRKNQQ